MLLRSWLSQAGPAERAAWVPVGRDERDPRRLWLLVSRALRETAPGAALVRQLTAAPGLDGWAIVERLLADLAPLNEPAWLVIDDVHELGHDALRQLELLIMRAPPELRFVLATRHDIRLGLHRLRLEGELAEIREPQLRFSVDEARELFAAAGVWLSEQALTRLHERTEGWAAGLRLAALSLAGHPDPERFERHSRHSAHAALIAEALNLLAGGSHAASPAGPRPVAEPLTDSELRVLRYLPTSLTAPEIASELFVSLNTIKTHMRNLYAKLGTHRRAETVAAHAPSACSHPRPREPSEEDHTFV